MERRAMSLGELHRQAPHWVWAYCVALPDGKHCGHSVPIPTAPFVIRWGADASSDMIRKRLRCSRCGTLGCTIRTPSCGGMNGEPQPFPVYRLPVAEHGAAPVIESG